ncbi:PREDICTED: uncharacterized protein LOC107194192 [Dufourea novaeangliae]|uniref:uncharacterized protein LOC107194192 n=1 Tax=Dufourea novaeangliae TaxID=178035 RepID=UPI000766F89A|nr:PREDICTED: uncharacterized protein LOC107194192 [Dufourea novaeangliae]
MPNRYCLLCGNRNQLDSYYSFPKDKECRKKWLTFCGIGEEVLNTVTKLCSNHFQEDDIIRKGKTTIVRPNAVPSVISKKRKWHTCSHIIKDCSINKQRSSTARSGTVDEINFDYADIDNANFDKKTVDKVKFEFVSVDENPTISLEETCTTVNHPFTSQSCENIQCFHTPATATSNIRYIDDRLPGADIRKAERALHKLKTDWLLVK